MYRIVVAVDTDEERARTIAESVASLPGTPEGVEVVLLNVYKDFDVSDDMGEASSANLFDPDDIPTSVEVAKERLKDTDIDTEIRREHGDPTEVILTVADEEDADAIALTGRKRSPTGKVLFGSVTQSVLLSADVPVFVTTN